MSVVISLMNAMVLILIDVLRSICILLLQNVVV